MLFLILLGINTGFGQLDIEQVYYYSSKIGWGNGPNGALVKTTDGGLQWTQQNSNTTEFIFKVFFINEDLGWACGGNGSVIKTTNGGDTWTPLNCGTTTHLFGVCFANQDQGWIAADSGIILATQNGGATWEQQTSGVNVTLRFIQFINANIGWVCGEDGVVLHTTNGGSNWTPQSTNTTFYLQWIDFVDSHNGFIAGGNYTDNSSIFLKTTDGGTTWIAQTLTSAPLFSTDFINPDNGYVSGRGGTILKTTNGDQSWISQSYDGFWFSDVYFMSQDTIYVFSPPDQLLTTTNGGNSWSLHKIVVKSPCHPSGWIILGVGSSHFGPALYMNFSYSYKNNIFTMRYLKADEFRFNVEGHYDQPALSCKEFGILYGRSYRKNNIILSLSAGVGYIKGIDRGKHIEYKEYEKVDISTFGMPFEAGFRFEFGFFGIGGSWYGNLNSKKSFSGGLFEISIGVLR
jgi:photosystem II stability/assembly factor-like uncharacterized protein